MEEYKLFAVWFSEPLITNGQRKSRFAEDELIRIENGKCVSGEPNHKILFLTGLANGRAKEMMAIHIVTLEPIIIAFTNENMRLH